MNQLIMKPMKLIFVFTMLIASLVAALSGNAKTSGATDESNNASLRSAAQLYSKNCASCHGKDGRSKTLKGKLKGARDISNREWHDNVSDERIFNSITNGRGKKMPAYSKKLSEPEIDAMVAFVRLLKR